MESPISPFMNASGSPNAAVGPLGHRCHCPLQIAELLTRIGEFLDRPTLLASLLVCHEWHRTLKYLLWTDIRLVQVDHRFQEPMTDDTIRQHASRVERLSIEVEPRLHQTDGNLPESLCLRTIDFPILRSLEIDVQQDFYVSDYSGNLEYLTSNMFRLMMESSSRLNSGGAGGGETLRKLQVLKINDFHFQYLPRDWTILWETLWSRLQVLSLVGTWWKEDQGFKEDAGAFFPDFMAREDPRFRELFDQVEMSELAKRLGPSWTMRDLTLIDYTRRPNEALFEVQRWMVLQCPKVVRLEWRVESPFEDEGAPSPMMQIRNAIVNAQLSNLDPPQFQDLQTVALPNPFQEADFILLAQAMPRLTELNMLGAMDFKDNSWWALVIDTPHHLETLRVLNVSGCDLRPITLHSMLCTLPHLEFFKGRLIGDMSLQADPRPWACKGTLKHLDVEFGVNPQKRRQSQALVVSRLAELEQLENLILGESNLYLDLSKPEGVLGDLRTLKRLKTFSLCTRERTREREINSDWGLAEMAWVKENWPRLKYVDCLSYKDEVSEDDRFPRTP